MRISQQCLVTWEASQNLLGTQKENRGNLYGCGRFYDLSGCIQTSSAELQQTKCLFVCLFLARQPPSGPGPSHSRGF
jgi:hypothetical protein